MKLKKTLAFFGSLILATCLIFGFFVFHELYSPNTNFNKDETYVFIGSGANYAQVLNIIKPYIKNLETFETIAHKKNYDTHIKPGKFLIKKNMGNNQIIKSLRQNIAVKIAFNNQERLENFAGRVATQIEADSLSLLNSFRDPEFLKSNGFNEENVLAIFVPNSYDFFWNTSANRFRDRMLKEYQKFWTPEKISKAKAQNLTPIQVSILASIVHKETVKKDERAKVAGVYLNRLERGMKLEADPTVIYAVKLKENDFNKVIKRVLNKDLLTDSRYNTYLYQGLPPGPIAMPDITALNAVLNPEKHNYIFFCASVTNFGYHEFAVTATQHEQNRQKYVAWVNAQGIKR